jgi:hypothetical protein
VRLVARLTEACATPIDGGLIARARPAEGTRPMSTPKSPRVAQERLTAAIATSGMWRYQVAMEAKIPPHVLTDILNGTRQPTDVEQGRLAKVLGKPVAELFPQPSQAAS